MGNPNGVIWAAARWNGLLSVHRVEWLLSKGEQPNDHTKMLSRRSWNQLPVRVKDALKKG